MLESIEKYALAIAAPVLGAIFAAWMDREPKTFKEKVFMVAFGAVFSYFLSPLAMDLFGFKEGLANSISFLIGAFGMSLADAVYRALKAADIWGFIQNRFGGPKA